MSHDTSYTPGSSNVGVLAERRRRHVEDRFLVGPDHANVVKHILAAPEVYRLPSPRKQCIWNEHLTLLVHVAGAFGRWKLMDKLRLEPHKSTGDRFDDNRSAVQGSRGSRVPWVPGVPEVPGAPDVRHAARRSAAASGHRAPIISAARMAWDVSDAPSGARSSGRSVCRSGLR